MLKSEKDMEATVKTGMTEDQLAEEIVKYDALIIRSASKVTAKVLEKVKKLKVIGRAGVGVDNVDMPTATAKGVIVMNTPDANTLSTAEQTITLIMGMARNLPQADASLKAKKWERNEIHRHRALRQDARHSRHSGRIGTEVAKRMASFGMKLIGYDPFITKEKAEALGIETMTVAEVVKKADIITFHVPKNKETTNMITGKGDRHNEGRRNGRQLREGRNHKRKGPRRRAQVRKDQKGGARRLRQRAAFRLGPFHGGPVGQS